MASRAKPKGSTPRTGRKRKPATIDLEAKEVVKEPSSEAKSPNSPKESVSDSKPAPSEKPEVATGQKSTHQSAPKPGTSQFGRSSGGGATSKKQQFATPASISKSLFTGGIGKMLLSALLGGVVVIGGLGAIGQMNNADRLPLIGSLYQTGSEETNVTGTNEAVSQLQAQLDELAAREVAQPVDLSPLNTRISSLETAITELNELQSSSTSLASRLSELETQMSAIDTAISEIASIETEGTAPSSDPQISATLIDLGARVGVLEQAENAVNQQNAVPSERISELEATLNTLSNQTIPDLAPLETRLDKAENTVAAIRETLAANTEKLSSLSTMSGELTSQIQTTKVSEKVARSIAANALGGALKNSDNLSVPISSIEALAGQSDETRRLAELSNAGIAGLSELSREFEIFASKIDAPQTAPAEAGLMDKFLANAKSLITIKPSGPIEGDTVSAILSRIRGHLSAENLQSIDGEWQQLPQDVRTDGEAWITRVNNRIEAMTLYNKISAQLAKN